MYPLLLPVLNAENDIGRCLLSIRNLKSLEEAYEVLVVDNGSTDRTPQIVRDLGFAMQVVPKVHVSALRNRGVAMARGDYVAFVDADVELSPYWLQHGLAAFADCKVVASGCFPGVPEDATWVQRAWDAHQRGRQLDDNTEAIAWLPSMNLIVRRDDFLAIGGFNEHLETAEDVDLCYRLKHRGTILYNSAMQAIHWGEARDLRTFWRKETWRGKGNLKGVQSHGFRLDELPSLGYPLYMILGVLLAVAAFLIDVWLRQLLLIPLSLFFLILPALILALNTAWATKRLALLHELFILYIIYGFARAYSVLRS